MGIHAIWGCMHYKIMGRGEQKKCCSGYNIQIFKFQQVILYIKISNYSMKKYAFILILLLPLALSQNCYNCLQGACTANGCTQCADGFMLSSQGWCGIFTPIEGCRIYDSLFTNRCTQCNPDRMLIQSRCYIKPQNCQVSDKNQLCMSCQAGFTLFKGSCYSQQIKNCPPGSLPTSGYCQSLRAQNCQRTLGDNKICDSCISGYTLINGRCLKVIYNASCPSGSCQCNNGFVYGQTCYQISIDQCNIYRDPIYCSACALGFVAIDGICLVPVKQDDVNCNVLAPLSDYCTGCNQNYFLNSDAFCQRNYNLTICPLPSGLFHLENSLCYYNDPRCDQIDMINNTYKCLWCQEGFSLINGVCQRNICILQGQDGVCQQVFIGYVLVGTNKFLKMPANCLAVSQGTSNCIQCSNFTRNVSMAAGQQGSYVCAYYDANCIQYNSNGSCIQCANQDANDGYILKNRFCYKKAQNCMVRSFNDQSQCQQCNGAYHLDPTDLKCYQNVQGCEVYLSGSDCKQCVSQIYVLYNKRCYAVSSECLDYDSNNMCRKCSQGLMPFQNICVYYHPYCLQYGFDKVCTLAASGWALGNGMTDAQKQYYRSFMMAGQQVTTSNGAASLNGLSGSGTYTSGGLVTSFPYANLVSVKISNVNMLGQIVGCNAGYNLINQMCVQKITANCELYTNDDICIRCQAQYTLMGDFSCAQGLQCATPQDVTNGRCLRCASGYILIGVQCFYIGSQATIDKWLTYSSFFKITFNDGSYMAWPRTPNCINQNNPLACSQCATPFQNIQGYCVMLVDKCTDYGFNSGYGQGLCRACQNGYTLWFGQCRKLTCGQVSNGLCSSCPANSYYFMGICLTNPQSNCRIYENNVCQLCNDGYYVSSQGACQSIVKGCLTTNPDTGRCLECRSTMSLYLQKCVFYINYCIDYDANNKCTNCQQNTVNRTQLLPDGTCAPLQGQCQGVDQTTKVCNKCNLGYTLIQQNTTMLCVNKKDNCILYDTFGRCTQCGPRFVLQNNQCRIYIQYCLAYAADQLSCLTCAANTVLNGGCCKINDQYCINYTFCSCNSCMSGYFLTNGICQKNPGGCDVFDYNINKCIKCANLYYLQQDGTCIYVDYITNGCQNGFNLTYGQSFGYQCVKCNNGFILNFTDNLCYGHNCLSYTSSVRSCNTCPLYYKLYKNNTFNDNSNYCIPYFCDQYTPVQNVCVRNSTFYAGGHIIVTVNSTITILYCLNVDAVNGKCGQCSNYRFPNSNTTYNLCYPFHCKNANQFMCTQCELGYILDPRYPGSCVAQFCSQFKFDGSCQTCTPPYTLSGSGICANTGCCDFYDTNSNTCTTPKKYYVLQNSVCLAGNCASYDPNKISVCLACMQGFTLYPDGTCRVTNCQQDTYVGDSCMICNKGFTVQFNTTTNKGICVPRYCLNYTADMNGCLSCPAGFVLNADKMCQADLCVNFLPTLICQNCVPYMTVDANTGRCVADCQVGSLTQCQCCKFGSALNKTSNLCQPVATYCLQNNTSTGLCDKCMDGYVSVSGQCIAQVANCRTPSMLGCIQCNPGYQVIDNCRCVPTFCLKQKADGSCAQCHPRFQLTSQGLCKPRDCQFFSAQTWACNGCFSRFTLTNGICVTLDCAVWADIENSTCKVCNSSSYIYNTQLITTGYEINNGGCYIKYCQDNPRNIYCTVCVPGFTVTPSGMCQCGNVANNGACVCPPGLVYDQDKGCIQNMDVCINRNQNTGACYQCPIQYDSINGECVASFCSNWTFPYPHVTKCQTCYPNFALKDGFCVSTLCLTYVTKNGYLFPQCTACPQGYTPFSNICIPTYCDSNTYNIAQGLCVNCTQKAYVLSADATRCVMVNCANFKAPSTCNACYPGYEQVNSICQSRNCTAWNAGYNCTACAPGYYLNGSLCYAYWCAAYDANLLCATCNDGFALAKNFTCIRINCAIDSKDKCLQCKRGFIYDSGSLKCVPSNCQKFTPALDGCDVCWQGFYKENGTCLDIYCNPNSFNAAYICQNCLEGYSFNTNGLCYPTSPGFCPPGKYYDSSVGGCIGIPVNYCQIYINNICMWCAPGYLLINKLCYSTQYCSKYSYFYGCYECMDGYYLDGLQCKLYTQDNNCLQSTNYQCVQCKPNYKLISGKCVLLPQYCTDVNINGKCINCVAGYIPTNGGCQLFDVNCVSVDSVGNCTQCVNNYYVAVEGICKANPPNCLTANMQGQCTQCATGYASQNYKCFKQYPFCALYSQITTFCIQCSTNFTLSGIQCKCSQGNQLILGQLCIKLPQNCLSVDASSYVCASCADGFTLTPDFRCVKNVTIPGNCAVYDPLSGVCQQCNDKYVLVNSICLACAAGQIKLGNQCFNVIANCLQYNGNGQCSVCGNGYTLSNGLCSAVNPPPFCAIYDPATGICQKCINNYQPSANGLQCVPVGCQTISSDGRTCASCLPGFVLTYGLCVRQITIVIQFCDSINPNTNTCDRCANGYLPSSDGKLCILINCLKMDQSGQSCINCVSPFAWNGQYCLYTTDFCSLYNYNIGYCTNCLAYTALDRNRCVPNYCSNYNYDSGVCVTCNNGYTLYNKLCYLIIQYCIAYGQSGVATSCVKCQSGYSLSSNGLQCIVNNVPSIPSCFAQSSGSVCNRCMYRYYQGAQMCSPYLPYCINIDPLGNCIACCFGSTLSNGKCVRDTNVRNCAQQVGSTCQKCANNYNYCSFCEACLPVTPNCVSYSGTGTCLQCIDNFSLLNGICVSMPVGFISGTTSTCRSGYFQNGNNCYRNNDDLQLYSTVTTSTTTTTSTTSLQGTTTSTSSSSSTTSTAYVMKSNGDALIIFGILINTVRGALPNNASYLLYYRSKINDPLVCWNSCIPTKIDSTNYVKDLVYPIIAAQVNIYLINQNYSNVKVDFKLLQ